MTNDHLDFHLGEVVLIKKASKPRYDMVKSGRIMALLPTLSKLLERIRLARLDWCLVLGDTQFRRRKKRWVHDTLAPVPEFLEDNRGMSRVLVSMDVEGGFDPLNRGLLRDLLAARGCPAHLNDWIGRWCDDCVVRFQFNGQISRDYHLRWRVPHGSPLSPFRFWGLCGRCVVPLGPVRACCPNGCAIIRE